MAVIKFLRDINNVGHFDRGVRIVVSLALLVPILSIQGAEMVIGWQAWLALVAVYPFLTGVVSWDPFYALFGIETHRPTKALSDEELEHDAKVTHDYLVKHHVIPPSAEQYETEHEHTQHKKAS